jgi:hypothetical protein
MGWLEIDQRIVYEVHTFSCLNVFHLSFPRTHAWSMTAQTRPRWTPPNLAEPSRRLPVTIWHPASLVDADRAPFFRLPPTDEDGQLNTVSCQRPARSSVAMAKATSFLSQMTTQHLARVGDCRLTGTTHAASGRLHLGSGRWYTGGSSELAIHYIIRELASAFTLRARSTVEGSLSKRCCNSPSFAV